MAVRFLYNGEHGLQIEADDNEDLTEQQAMIVAVRDLASGMSSVSQALWEINNEFDIKKFYDEDTASRDQLKQAVECQRHCKARLAQSVPVKETHEGKTAWEGGAESRCRI
jgi:hypothetical protein